MTAQETRRPPGRPRAKPDPGLRTRIREHLARYAPVCLSIYELARVLQLPAPAGNGKDRVLRELQALAAAGTAVMVVEAASEIDERLVTRWRLA